MLLAIKVSQLDCEKSVVPKSGIEGQRNRGFNGSQDTNRQDRASVHPTRGDGPPCDSVSEARTHARVPHVPRNAEPEAPFSECPSFRSVRPSLVEDELRVGCLVRVKEILITRRALLRLVGPVGLVQAIVFSK